MIIIFVKLLSNDINCIKFDEVEEQLFFAYPFPKTSSLSPSFLYFKKKKGKVQKLSKVKYQCFNQFASTLWLTAKNKQSVSVLQNRELSVVTVVNPSRLLVFSSPILLHFLSIYSEKTSKKRSSQKYVHIIKKKKKNCQICRKITRLYITFVLCSILFILFIFFFFFKKINPFSNKTNYRRCSNFFYQEFFYSYKQQLY